MRLITESKNLVRMLNKSYIDFDPSWPNMQFNRIELFKQHIEDTAGLVLDYQPTKDKYGRFGYHLNQIEVIDKNKYLMFLLKWS